MTQPLSTTEPFENAETILVADDNAVMVQLTRRILERRGYRVLVAASAADAVCIVKCGERIDLLVTDVKMPGMNGPELVACLHETGVDLRVLYTSGYPQDDAGLPDISLVPTSAFLPKPWTPQGLGNAVRELLDTPAPRTLSLVG